MSETNDRLRELTLRTALLNTDTVLVTVHDTGQGLGAEEPEQIFQPFFTTKPSGMGLGLSVSRSIVESQGGKLWATPNPEPDRGMSFQFTLPIHSHPPGPSFT